MPGFFGDLIPFFLFVLASFTDYLDGLLARLFKEESKLGELLDPIADKILVSTALLLLIMNGTIKNFEVIAAIIIITREIIISGLREFLAGPALVQNDVNINSFDNVWLHTSEDLISNGEYVANNSEMYITYIMDTGFNSFSTISNEVNDSTDSITLVSSDNYAVGDVILVDNQSIICNPALA